ncbi:hypothetical protein M9H77_14335 [Catharanthus roseus]|uniref:Uncharacterized protein n=1 Tax=Catharanthus roseus TaxID=4058 RepID=A0ACC0BMV1_CATRO|nr:hypothetical protein M9H77_14335 [Catharanthus roseus]
MEEVQAHVHPVLIVPDVLTRQHEHRSGLIWSVDHKTRLCTTALGGARPDRGSPSHTSDLGLVMYPCIAASATSAYSARPSRYWCDMVHIFLWLPYHDRGLVPFDLWRVEVPLICYEIMEYHRPGCVMHQFAVSDNTRVYIGNPANRDTRTVGYQPARVNRRMMKVDDMATGVIQGLPSSPTQIASFAKKA